MTLERVIFGLLFIMDNSGYINILPIFDFFLIILGRQYTEVMGLHLGLGRPLQCGVCMYLCGFHFLLRLALPLTKALARS